MNKIRRSSIEDDEFTRGYILRLSSSLITSAIPKQSTGQLDAAR